MKARTPEEPDGQELLCRIVWRLLVSLGRRSLDEDDLFSVADAVETLSGLATPQTRRRIDRMIYHAAGETPDSLRREIKRILRPRGRSRR